MHVLRIVTYTEFPEIVGALAIHIRGVVGALAAHIRGIVGALAVHIRGIL